MSRQELDEHKAIEVLRRALAGQQNASVCLGIGDDAAVLRSGRGKLVWSIDSSIEGTHFDLTWLSLEQAAARAMTAALSDLSAMGAAPLAAICALGVPSGTSRADFRAVARGQAKIARRADCPLVGGDIARSTRVSFTTSVLGQVARPVTRGGAGPGDEVWLVGTLGEAAVGLRVLQRGGEQASRGVRSAARSCVRAWISPPLLLEEGQGLVGRASAMTDVSDGLASELNHISAASGVCVYVERWLLEACASEHLRKMCTELELSLSDVMLYGGEDYALVATGKPRSRPADALVIGRVERGKGAWLQTASGRQRLRRGFDHLAE